MLSSFIALSVISIFSYYSNEEECTSEKTEKAFIRDDNGAVKSVNYDILGKSKCRYDQYALGELFISGYMYSENGKVPDDFKQRGIDLLTVASNQGLLKADFALCMAYGGNINEPIFDSKNGVPYCKRIANISTSDAKKENITNENIKNASLGLARLQAGSDSGNKYNAKESPTLLLEKEYEAANNIYREHSYGRAFNKYQPLALQGYAPAQYSLAYLYEKGEGVQQDYNEAIRLYKLAAEQGYASSQINLGHLYYAGEGVPRDYNEAIRWYRLAAEQGNAAAQYQLGEMYGGGEGVPQDYNEANRWYRLAAEQGYASAQFALGFSYSNSLGFPQDDAEAMRWYQLAAEQGNAMAQRALTNMGALAGSTGVSPVAEVSPGAEVPPRDIMTYCSKITAMSKGVSEQISRDERVSDNSVSFLRAYGKTECWGSFDTDNGPVDRMIVGIRRDASGAYYVDVIL